MHKPIPTLLVGTGGYGARYVNSFLNGTYDGDFALVGAVDPYAANAKSYPLLKEIAPIYNTMAEFFANHSAALTIIVTPVHLHFQQCITAISSGSHVLCEKPLVPTMDELNRLAAIDDKILAVGFQLCYSDVILSIKQRILAGEFGRPQHLKCYVSWPRGWDYYGRGTKWAGKIKSEDGIIVYDSIASNAVAHFIQNMQFLLGPNMEESAPLTHIQAECYRANDIESFDTIALKGRCQDADIYFSATHAARHKISPYMDYSFENARIWINAIDQDFECTIHHKDGRFENLGSCWGYERSHVLKNMAKRIRGEDAFICTAKTVGPFTSFVNELFENTPFHDFPRKFVDADYNDKATYVKNLHIDLWDCYHANKLPSEAALPWAKRS